MEKTINSIRFVPLHAMTEEDWKILDWTFLRNKAKNRIAAMIVEGTLTGFYHVNVLMKARGKPNYYWPSDDEGGALDSDTADFFRHEADDEFESTDVENVDQMILEMQLLPAEHLAMLLTLLYDEIKVLDYILDEDKSRIKDMYTRTERGMKLDEWDFLLLAIYLYRWWGLSKWERTMASIDRNLNG